MSHTSAHTPPDAPVADLPDEATVTVTLILPTALRAHTGQQGAVTVRGSTVRAVLTALDAQYPGLGFALFEETGRLRKFVNVYVNGRNVRYLRDLDTPLAPGATIHVFPSVAGG